MLSHAVSSSTRRRGGYTLIELMIVIGLLGLAGALLVPHMVQQDSMHLQAAVRQVIADLSFAQSDALANQEFRRVHFYADGRGYCLIRVNSTNYATPWDDFDPEDIEYIDDPLATSGELGRYIMDFDADPRYRDVVITEVDIDGEGSDADGDIVYDQLGGTIQSGNIPGTGGEIVIQAGDERFTVRLEPFTGKMTVIE